MVSWSLLSDYQNLFSGFKDTNQMSNDLAEKRNKEKFIIQNSSILIKFSVKKLIPLFYSIELRGGFNIQCGSEIPPLEIL